MSDIDENMDSFIYDIPEENMETFIKTSNTWYTLYKKCLKYKRDINTRDSDNTSSDNTSSDEE